MSNLYSYTAKELHDRLGSMIDQVGQPDYSLRELVAGLREVRDALLALSAGPADADIKPVAWRYRYRHMTVLANWKYVELEEDCNPSQEYEREPLYSRPATGDTDK